MYTSAFVPPDNMKKKLYMVVWDWMGLHECIYTHTPISFVTHKQYETITMGFPFLCAALCLTKRLNFWRSDRLFSSIIHCCFSTEHIANVHSELQNFEPVKV